MGNTVREGQGIVSPHIIDRLAPQQSRRDERFRKKRASFLRRAMGGLSELLARLDDKKQRNTLLDEGEQDD